MTNTIRNVTMDEIVFITSCHVSLNRNSGPTINQPTISVAAALNASGCPLNREKACANREYHEDFSTIVDPPNRAYEAVCASVVWRLCSAATMSSSRACVAARTEKWRSTFARPPCDTAVHNV